MVTGTTNSGLEIKIWTSPEGNGSYRVYMTVGSQHVIVDNAVQPSKEAADKIALGLVVRA